MCDLEEVTTPKKPKLVPLSSRAITAMDRLRTIPLALKASALPSVLHAMQIEVAISGEDPEPVIVVDIPEAAENKDVAGAVRATEASVPRLPKVGGQVAVISIRGTIGQHRSTDYWSDTHTEAIAGQIGNMVANPSIGAIVLDIDSPGGIVYGTPELAETIRGARGVKPIYGLANGSAASAAYWIGASVDKLFVIPSGEVGSIGVWSAHTDMSGALEQQGVDITLISAGKYKVEGHPFAPLDDEARADMQAGVDRYFGMFLADVARGRGEKAIVVKEAYGQGRMLGAEAAKAVGMVDGIATLPELLAGIMRPRQQRQSRGAALGLGIDLEEAGYE